MSIFFHLVNEENTELNSMHNILLFVLRKAGKKETISLFVTKYKFVFANIGIKNVWKDT